MTRTMKLCAALLACLTIANGVPAPFPRGKTLVYNYFGDVKAGTIEPAPYASQFSISGQLHVKHDSSDPSLQSAYYVAFTNVRTDLRNGLAEHFQRTMANEPIPEAAKVIEDPFLMVYNEMGQLAGVKIPENEAGWSMNMKLAIASMLQLDLTNMKLDQPIKPLNFMSQEKTIYGDCWTSYDIHAKYPADLEQNNKLMIHKFGSPMNCSNFNVREFNHEDSGRCNLPAEQLVNTASIRVFEIENQGDSVLIKTLIAHGGINYFPRRGRSEAHYILNNASFVLEKIVESSEIQLPVVDFQKIPLISDLSYRRPQTNYAENAALDITQGRQVVRQDILMAKLKELLGEAADYLQENNLEMMEPDFRHGQTINRILDMMKYMEFSSLEQVFSGFSITTNTRDIAIRGLFIGMIQQVGTIATWNFAINLIKTRKISDLEAMEMLAKLPRTVREPMENLLVEMEELVKTSESITLEVRKSSILCWSTLIYRIFKDVPTPEENLTLRNHLKQLFDHFMIETSCEMKVVYLMAIKNVRVGNIYELLAPIIRGDVQVSEDPIDMRLKAIWAVKEAIANDYNVAHGLLWPIMADYNLPLKLRIAAYDTLIQQVPSMTSILHIYWFMFYEKNEHLYNYHYTTIQSLANSVDSCNYQLRELATKILRFTKIHSRIPYQLSASYMVDAMNEVYGYGEKFGASITVNERTGVPEVIHLEHVVVNDRRPINDFEIYLRVDGMDGLFKLFSFGKFRSPMNLNDENVINVLKNVASDMPPVKKLHLDLVLLLKGRVVLVNHYNEKSLMKLSKDMESWIDHWRTELWFAKAHVFYENMYEKQVISEMGLPVTLETRSPFVHWFQFDYNLDFPTMNVKVDLDAKIWAHGDSAMSIYNPLVSVWHSIRRSTAFDLAYPMNITIDFASSKLKFRFPRLPATKLLTAGIRIHTKDITTVTEDENNALKNACQTCNYEEVVTKGSASKRNVLKTSDSIDTGLQFTFAVYDCENERSPVLMRKEWLRALVKERTNCWNDFAVHTMLVISQQLKNHLLSPQMGSCGSLIKIQPSTVHPMSQVSLKWIVKPSIDKINLHGYLNAIAAATNQSARMWELNMTIDASDEYLQDSLHMKLTRFTQSENDFIISLDGERTYPAPPADPLKIGRAEQEITNGRLIISMDHRDNEVLNNVGTIEITVKGELSDEQKNLFNQERLIDACKNDQNNPLFKSPSNLVPKTAHCLNQVIEQTTLRKYTIDIEHKNISRYIISEILTVENLILSAVVPHITYTSGFTAAENVKINVEFPLKRENVDLSIVTPFRSYDLTDVNLEVDTDPPRHRGFGPDNDNRMWMWMNLLDNTRSKVNFLRRYPERKVCSLYPNITLTLDGSPISYLISNQWTLASGDYVNTYFASFVKNVDDKLAMIMYAQNETIEVVPVGDRVQVKINGKVHESLETESKVSMNRFSKRIFGGDAWTSKVRKLGEQIIVEIDDPRLIIVHTVDSVSMFMGNELQGMISGLCGRMDGTHKTEIPTAYVLDQ